MPEPRWGHRFTVRRVLPVFGQMFVPPLSLAVSLAALHGANELSLWTRTWVIVAAVTLLVGSFGFTVAQRYRLTAPTGLGSLTATQTTVGVLANCLELVSWYAGSLVMIAGATSELYDPAANGRSDTPRLVLMMIFFNGVFPGIGLRAAVASAVRPEPAVLRWARWTYGLVPIGLPVSVMWWLGETGQLRLSWMLGAVFALLAGWFLLCVAKADAAAREARRVPEAAAGVARAGSERG